jgi:hypothetical protein
MAVLKTYKTTSFAATKEPSFADSPNNLPRKILPHYTRILQENTEFLLGTSAASC